MYANFLTFCIRLLGCASPPLTFTKPKDRCANCHNLYFMAAERKHRKARQLFLQGQGRKGRVGTSILGVSPRTAVCEAGWQSGGVVWSEEEEEAQGVLQVLEGVNQSPGEGFS